MTSKKEKNRFTKNDKLLIKISILYLLPLYVVGIIFRYYDIIKKKLKNLIYYKILKRKKEDKIEEWWIS